MVAKKKRKRRKRSSAMQRSSFIRTKRKGKRPMTGAHLLGKQF